VWSFGMAEEAAPEPEGTQGAAAVNSKPQVTPAEVLAMGKYLGVRLEVRAAIPPPPAPPRPHPRPHPRATPSPHTCICLFSRAGLPERPFGAHDDPRHG